MKLKGQILLVIGIMIGVFSIIIPFSEHFTKEICNIIYFRGILLSGILICIFGAANLKGIYQNIVMSCGSGLVALILMSTYNLFCDVCMNTYNYYLWTFIIVGVVLIILITLELWSRLLRHLN